jgi:hypothetical protein
VRGPRRPGRPLSPAREAGEASLTVKTGQASDPSRFAATAADIVPLGRVKAVRVEVEGEDEIDRALAELEARLEA